MFAYCVFKALVWREEHSTFFSPLICSAWEKIPTPWGEFFYLKTVASELDRDRGIFAASLEEAQQYGQQIYLVAPDPRCRLVLGTFGWRAEAAMIVAPVTSEESASLRILSAYHAGYPQVVGILAWAARYAPPKEGCRILQNILDDCQDEEVLQVVVDSAVVIGEDGMPILEQLSHSQNMWIWMRVIDACKRPVEYVRPFLQYFVCHEMPSVRTHVAYACSVHGVGALPLLERLAHDDFWSVRHAVAKSIRQLGEAAIPILEKLRYDKDKIVRFTALNSLRAVDKKRSAS